MATKRVFYVSTGRLSAYTWQSGNIGDPVVFGADESGLAAFSRYLEGTPNDPVHMLVDFVEEEFREDTIPHVFGGDRRALVATKLNRLFRDPIYSHAMFQGRDETGRRDDRMLFTALIRPDLLAPWVSNMSKHRVPLAGIYSLALITDLLFKALKIDSSHALVVSAQSGGLRQTFFLNKQLKISRLAILPSIESGRYASFLLSEVEKIRRYLTSLRHLPHDSPVNVYVLGDSQQLEDIERQSPDSVTTRHHLIPLEEAARAAGMKGAYGSRFADAIFAHLLAKKSPPNQYAPENATRYFSLHRARVGLIAASVLMLVVGVSWSGLKFLEGVIAAEEAQSARRQAAFYNERYTVARERLPKTPVESHQIKVAVEIADKLDGYKADPVKMMTTLGRVLSRYPQLKLDRMAWRASTDVNAPVGDLTVTSQRSVAPRPDPGLVGVTQGEQEKRLYHLAFVKGRIAPFDGDYRRALDLINRFAEEIRSQPGVNHVRIQSLPLDVGSDSTLQGDAVGSTAVRDANFELRVAMEDKPGETG